QWAAMKPGSYVCTKTSRRVARVEAFDVDDGRCVIRDEDGVRHFDLDLAIQEMEGLPPNDLRALAIFEPDRVRKMANEDPQALVKMALSQTRANRMEFREFKARLCPLVIPVDGWSSWWNKAKPLLKRDPLIEMIGVSQPTLVLRAEALSYEAELAQRFERAAKLDERVAVAMEFAREAGNLTPAPDLLARLREGLLAKCSGSATDTLSVAVALDHLGEACGDEALKSEAVALAQGLPNLPEALAGLEDERVARKAMGLARRAAGEAWGDVLEAALPAASVRRAEAFARELVSLDAARLTRAANEILSSRDRKVEAFVWLWKAVCEGKEPALAGFSAPDLTIALFGLAHRLGMTRAGPGEEEAKKQRGVIRSALTADNFAAVNKAFEAANEDAAESMRAALEKNRGLADDVQTRLIKDLLLTHPHVFEEKVEPWLDEKVVWTTREGLEKRQAELRHLETVEALENSRAIGEAAARGDLSENAEWTAAVEEQRLLSERAQRMRGELAMAKVLTAEVVPFGRVGVGSRVRVRVAGGSEEQTFTFLGPWDVDLAKRVYSYKAPLSQAFMGRRVGETVAAGEGDARRQYEILAIESAL
ncbi:MAG TPA: GreA/GreB family elongation factor, partial [Candidatus Brocadiia bacterium]|nr:GreA/GreB family elongation factor [Candidatus Brocadiia bacterium]